MLTVLEIAEKSLRMKKEEVSEILDLRKKEQLTLKQHVEKEIDKLRFLVLKSVKIIPKLFLLT